MPGELTLTAYSKDLNAFFLFLKKEFINKIEDVDYYVLRSFLSYLYGKYTSKASIERKISSLRSFFKFLFAKGCISDNPASLLKTPKKEKKYPEIIKVDDVLRLLEAPDKKTFLGFRDHVLLNLLYVTGIRVSELIGIDVEDFKSIIESSKSKR